MRAATLVFALLVLDTAVVADTVVLKGGKKLEGVAVQEGTDAADTVVVNPYNSRCPQMTYGVTDKDRIPRDKIVEVVLGDSPLVEYRLAAWDPKLWDAAAWSDENAAATAAAHVELAKKCEKAKLNDERDREFRLALCADPANAEALAAVGRTNWTTWSKGNPLADKELRRLEQEFVGRWEGGELKQLANPADFEAQWKQMEEHGTTRPRVYLERARRSRKQAPGRREKVPLTVRSELCPGATYCIFVPDRYDPLVPTGLVIGLHGGGRGGKDSTLVTGSGEAAMPFYVDVAAERGVIVVCPTALEAPWSAKKNEALLDALVEEMKILFNVDENRIWLTGHSMGGFGSWYWGPKRAEVWAAFAPCAGGGGPATGGLPVYVYHGTDDNIVGVQDDRAAADVLKKDKADFVYTEVDKVGHGFPDWARKDIFKFFAGRWKDDGKKRATGPRSSFDRKPTKDEVKCFGDPAATGAPPSADDTKLSALVAELMKGGGRGLEASKELATRKDAKTLAAVAHVLHSKKASTDTRVLAAQTIGAMGMPEGVKQLAPECSNDDFRVLDAVVEALGRIGGKETAEPLVRAGKKFAEFWERAGTGSQFVFTEYETRCQSFALLCTAFGAAGDAATAVPVLEKEVVNRVFAPAKPYTVPVDDRFTQIPPRARRELMTALADCLVKLKDARGKALLTAATAAWKAEAALVGIAEDAISKL
jgi:dienelactone hydrolase